MVLKKTLIVFVINLFVTIPSLVHANEDSYKEWLIWLDSLKNEMVSRGITPNVIEKAYGNNTYYHKEPEVLIKDKQQTEFVLSYSDYINKIVNMAKVAKARKYYNNLRTTHINIEKDYGVPLNYLVAFWAIESNFGQNMGKYNLIDSLTNLSYKNKREIFFKNELFNVLKIMEKFNLENDKMLGSWAGAMGHFQFMPSTYNAYAIDYDKDGVIDIWDSFDDAMASAANYLNSLGWKKDEPWGLEIKLPLDFDYELLGYNNTKTIDEWNKIGIKSIDGKKLEYDLSLKASVILPEGKKGKAYIIFDNFKKIMVWNRSENYALAVANLADYIKNNKKYKPLNSDNRYKVTTNDVKNIQIFANQLLKTNLRVDGILGYETKKAIKMLQRKARMQQDGYPDYQLLLKIKRYNPKIGFVVPVQPKKLIKK